MADEAEYKQFAAERFQRYLRELGWKSKEEETQEAMEIFDATLQERAERLKQAGIGIDHIAVCLGVHRSTVIRMRNPEAKERYNAYMREYMRRYRAKNKGE